MAGYDSVPSGSRGDFVPFELRVSEDKISDFKQLLKLSPVGSATFENEQQDRRFGMPRRWLADTKEYWLNGFDWRSCEDHVNSFPNFRVTINDDNGVEFQIHFVALFSQRTDAIPIAFFHGWPGSFLEFLPMLDVMRKKYAASSLPYHLIVPSLIGYTLSSGPPTEKNFGTRDVARVMNKLMVMLGFDGGYISQGGDIGSGIARILATGYESCKAVHVNMCPANLSIKLPEGAINAEEQAALERRTPWQEYGTGYAKEHGTRPATIGLVLASSPLALLAWIGEKFLEWSDEDPSLDTILEAVSLYWFTETFPRSIFPYRERWGPKEPSSRNEPSRQQTMATYIEKPFGYSWFPYELFPTPKALAAKTGNLVWHRQHTKGGHFAALERPEDFARDIEDFAATAWPLVGSSGQTLL